MRHHATWAILSLSSVFLGIRWGTRLLGFSVGFTRDPQVAESFGTQYQGAVMRGSVNTGRHDRVKRTLFAYTVVMAMLVASMVSVGVIAETAEARGPEYNGTQTQSGGPAYFGPAPNLFP